VAEVDEVVWGSVGERPIRSRPDILGRVELRRIRGEMVDMEPRVSREEGPNLPPSVDGAAIPEQIHGAAKMPEEMLQERLDVEARQIPGSTAKIERQPPPSGRQRQAAANREAVVTVAVAQIRSLPLGGPGATDIGDEQKAALIDEDEMGATLSGVFLSAAIRRASTEQWRPHPAPRHVAPASDNSSPVRSGASRRDRGDTECRTPDRSMWSPAPGSRDRWCSRPGAGPLPAGGPAWLSALWTIPAAVPGSAWRAAPAARDVDTPATTETPNSPRRGAGGRPLTVSVHPSAAAPQTDGAFPVARGSQKVSCPIG